MIQVLVLTLICLIGTTVGFYFLEGKALRTTLYLAGCVLWLQTTLVWWFTKLLDKFIK